MTSVVTAVLNEKEHYFETEPLYMLNYGNTLMFDGVELPVYFEVHFAKSENGEAVTQIGEDNAVLIPDEMLLSGDQVYAWIYLHDTPNDAYTRCTIRIPVIRRANVTGAEPTPVQQDIIEQAIAALQSGVDEVQEIAAGMPGQIDAALQEAKASGEFDGPPGFSPTVDVDSISGGHRVTITDAEGEHPFNVMDGKDGGAAGVIDDDAGAGDLNKTWSADKMTTELDGKADSADLDGKADKADTVLTTTLSRGRKANTTAGTASMAFGNNVEASAFAATAIGDATTASSYGTFAQGRDTVASGEYSSAGGVGSTASGARSFAHGSGVEAKRRNQHVFGAYNVPETGNASSKGTYVEIVGNGVSDSSKSNARALDWSGNERLAGDVYVGCNADSSGGVRLARIPNPPSTYGTYTLTASVTNEGIEYTWIPS